MTDITQPIPCRIKNVAVGGHVAGVEDIYDDAKQKTQQAINEDLDNIVEGYLYEGDFYEEAAHTTLITGEAKKLYIDIPNNSTYRYNGSAYMPIGGGGGGSYVLPTASAETLGGVKVGSNLSIDGNGVLSATDTTYNIASGSSDGLMSSSDKSKLDGIEAGAQQHIAPTTAEVKTALGTGSGTSKYLREDGTWETPPDTTYESRTAAESGTDLSLVTTGEKYNWNDKAGQNGYYKDLHVGLADNLFGETETNDVFTDRTTAGWQDVVGSDEVNFGGASIKSIKGNTVAWNSMYSNTVTAQSNCTVSKASDRTVTITRAANGAVMAKFTISSMTNGSTDKFYCRCVVTPNNVVDGQKIIFGGMNNAGHVQAGYSKSINPIAGDNVISFVSSGTVITSAYNYLSLRFTGNDNMTSAVVSGFLVVNLTRLFGSGNEPTSTSAFEKWMRDNVGYPENIVYPQVLRTIIPAKSFTFASEGFNAYIDGSAKVLGGKQYQITGAYTSITLNGNTITPDKDGFFTPSIDGTLVITGGGSDTCVHLVWSGGRNGDYATYWKQTKTIPLTTIEGKLAGTGSSVVIFPDGMKKDGDVCDEIREGSESAVAIKRVGSQTITGAIGDTITLTGCSLSATTFTCASDIGTLSEGVLTLTAAASDVDVYYELATPLEYVVTNFEMPVDYKVDDYGTEELNLGNTSSVVSCAPIMDIKYGINAPDAVKNLPLNYVSVQEQQFSDLQKKQALTNLGIQNGITALADATDLASAIALVNQMKEVLVNSGIMAEEQE